MTKYVVSAFRRTFRRTVAGDRGFSLIELVVSIAIVLVVTATMFELVNTASGAVEMELERIDMQQRLRATTERLFEELIVAGAGAASPPVAPFRRGEREPDAAGSVFADRVSVSYVPPDGSAADIATVTYWLRTDPDAGPHLMRYDGHESDLPLADHVSAIRFDYFGADGQPLDRWRFADGPWVPDAVAPTRFDADLLAIRRIRVTLRIGASRVMLRTPLPDHQMAIDVSPRNLNLP